MKKKRFSKESVFVLGAVLVMLFGVQIIRPAFTGYAVYEGQSDRINFSSSQNAYFTWSVPEEGVLGSLKMSGTLGGLGSARVYLVHAGREYLVYDAVRIPPGAPKLPPGPTEARYILTNLEYADSQWDTDNNGIESLDGVVDLTVENTRFSRVPQEKLCTVWSIVSLDTNKTTTMCQGDTGCCSLVELEPSGSSWDDVLYSHYGKDGATRNNQVRAMVIFANYSLEADDPYSDIVYSEWAEIPVRFVDDSRAFELSCVDTCNLPGINATDLVFRVELDSAEINIDSIEYAMRVPNLEPVFNEIIPNITIPKNGRALINLSYYFTDPEGEALVFGSDDADNLTIRIQNEIASVAPHAGFRGIRTVYFTASDSEFTTSTNEFMVTVGPGRNRAPMQSAFIHDISLAAGGSVTIDLNSHFRDTDGDLLTFSHSEPEGLHVTIADGIATIAAVRGFTGQTSLYFTAYDSELSAVSNVFSVMVGEAAVVAQSLDVLGRGSYRREESPVFTIPGFVDKNGVRRSIRAAERSALRSLQTDDGFIKASVYDSIGRMTDIAPELLDTGAGIRVRIEPGRQMRAGRYTLEVDYTVDDITYTNEQDFTWGVLAMNTHKSVYLPGELAEISMAVLSDTGRMVCTADVTLEITDPNGDAAILSTDNGEITVTPACTVYGPTDRPDYYSTYRVGGAGTYAWTLTAVTLNGERSISDSFEVRESVPFDVARNAPTRIFPWVPYEVEVYVTPSADYSGTVAEYVPASFDIKPQDGLTISVEGDAKKLTWNIDMPEGQTTIISYEFDAPDLTPYLFTLGALEIGSWSESREWMVASDATTVIVRPNANGAFNTWAASGSGGYADVDEIVTYQGVGDGTVRYADKNDDGGIEIYQVNETTIVGVVQEVTVYMYALVEDTLEGAQPTASVFLSGWKTKTACSWALTYTWTSLTWSGLSSDQAAFNGMLLNLTAPASVGPVSELYLDTIYAEVVYGIVDNDAPLWRYNSTNLSASGYTGRSAGFGINWSDAILNVDKTVFSFDAGSGSFVNDTPVSVGAQSVVRNESKTITAAPNQAIRWKWYANDTEGNMNVSSEHRYVIGGVYWNQSTLNFTSAQQYSETSAFIRLTGLNDNTDATVSCTGSCSQIQSNFSTQNLNDAATLVNFSCSTLTPGNYLANFSVSSTESSYQDNISINCTVVGETTGPDVASLSASPQKVPNGSTVNITASITDGSGVSFVKAMFYYPNGTNFQNATMLNRSAIYWVDTMTANISSAGTYNVTIWANDTLGNVGSSAKTWFTPYLSLSDAEDITINGDFDDWGTTLHVADIIGDTAGSSPAGVSLVWTDDFTGYGSSTTSYDVANGITVFSDYVYIAGEVFNQSGYGKDEWRIEKRYKANGSLIWWKNYTVPGRDAQARKVQADADRVYVIGSPIVGTTQSFGVKAYYAANGSMIWSFDVDSVTFTDLGLSMHLDSGTLYVGGALANAVEPGTNKDWTIYALDVATGLPSWKWNQSDSTNNEQVSGLYHDSGTLYAVGFVDDIVTGVSGLDAVVRAINTTSSVIRWEWQFTSPGAALDSVDSASDVIVDSGIVYTAGYFSGQDYDWMINAFNASNGSLIWQKNITSGLSESDQATSLAIYGDQLIVGGWVGNTTGVGLDDQFLVSLTTGNGTQNWNWSYNSDEGFADWIEDIFIDGSTVYLAGAAFNESGVSRRFDWRIAAMNIGSGSASGADIANVSLANDDNSLFATMFTNGSLDFAGTNYYRFYISTDDSLGNATTPEGTGNLSFRYNYRVQVNGSKCYVYNWTDYSNNVSGCDMANNSKGIEVAVPLNKIGAATGASINVSFETGSSTASYDFAPDYRSFISYTVASSGDAAAPTVYLNTSDGTNTSDTFFVFNFTATDASGIKNATLWTNFSGTWAANESNATAIASSTSSIISSTPPEGIFKWNVYVCDLAATPNCGFAAANKTITIDRTAPTFSSNSANVTSGTDTGDYGGFGIILQDSVGIDAIIFSYDNGSGWVNESPVSSGGFSVIRNESKTLNAAVGATIQWKWYANDTLGNLGESPTFSAVMSDCGKLMSQDTVYSLSHNVSSAGDCFTVLADNVTIDCGGYRIEHGTASGVGVTVNGYDNLTVRHCNFRAVTGSGGNSVSLASSSNHIMVNNTFLIEVAQQAASLSYVTESLFENNTVQITADYAAAVSLQDSHNNSIINNSLNVSGTNVFGIQLVTTAADNLIKQNTFEISGANSNGIEYGAPSATQFDNNTIAENLFKYKPASYDLNFNIVVAGQVLAILRDQAIGNYTMGILLDGHFLRIIDSTFGEIRFTEGITGIGTNLSHEVRIADNSVIINSSVNSGLDKAANITLYGIGDRGYLYPSIYKDGALCTDCYNFTSLSADTVIFNVTGAGNYSIRNYPDISAPTVSLDTQDGINTSDTFFVFNFTGSDMSGIANATLWANFSGIWAKNETNQSAVSSGATTFINVTGIADGRYVWNVYVCDRALSPNCGFATSNKTITVDRTAPTVSVAAAISPASPLTANDLTCSITATEGATGLYANVTWYADGVKNETESNLQLTSGQSYGFTAISSDTTTKNEEWSCNVTVFDTVYNIQAQSTDKVTIQNSLPTTPTLSLPSQGDHTNDNTTTFDWSDANDADSDPVSYQLHIFTEADASNPARNITAIASSTYTLTTAQSLADGNYSWRVRANDSWGYSAWSTNRTVVIDTVFPDVVITLPASDNTTVVKTSITLNISCSDPNLYRALVNITNSTGGSDYENFTDSITATQFNFTETIDVSGWTAEEKTIEVSCTDDHTYGSLRGLTYDIQSNGINFCRGSNCKKVWAGYYAAGSYHFLTAEQIADNNVQFRIGNRTQEYKFNMSFIRPGTDVKFGFAIPKLGGLELRNAATGHFAWGDWYFDFNDLLGTGFNITVLEITDYWVVYTSTAFCSVPAGQTCILDPVVGGLNTRTEYYTFNVDRTSPTSQHPSNNVSNSVKGESVGFGINISDTSQVDTTIFAFYNGTQWINDTAVSIGASSVIRNETKTVPYHTSANFTIRWKWYMNDTAGNSDVTEEFSSSIFDCGIISTPNSVWTLTRDHSSSGTCFKLTEDNITVNCDGHTVEYGTGGSGYGINLYLADNHTVYGCNIRKDPAGGGTNNYGFTISQAHDAHIENNIISTHGTVNSMGFYILGANRNHIINNTIFTNGTGTQNHGIFITSSNADYNTIANNTIILRKSSSEGIYISGNDFHNITGNLILANVVAGDGITLFGAATNSYVAFNTINVSGSNSQALDLLQSGGYYPANNTFRSNTILASGGNDLILRDSGINQTTLIDQPISDYSIQDFGSLIIVRSTGYGEVIFLALVNGSGKNLSSDISFAPNSAYINASKPGLNKAANITLYGVGNSVFALPVILKDGSLCTDCYNFTALTSSNVIFNVTGAANYTIVDFDTDAPVWSRYSTNITDTTDNGDIAGFGINWSDEAAVAYTIFSFDPGSGSFSNDTPVSIFAKSVVRNETKTITAEMGQTIRWKWYANDTGGRMNVSDVWSHTIPAPSAAPTVHLNTTDGANTSATIFGFNFTATDTDGIKNATLWTNYSGIWAANESNNTAITSGISFIINSTPPEGIFAWNIYACDHAETPDCGFAASNYTIAVDRSGPAINLESPHNNSGDNDGNILFSYNVSDTFTIKNCSLILNAALNQTNLTVSRGVSQNFTVSSLPAGKYNWSIECYDNSSGYYSATSGLYYVSVVRMTEFTGATTDLSALADIENITNFILSTGSGMINYSEPINLSGGADIDTSVDISLNYISVDSENLNQLNRSAIVKLYNLAYEFTPVLYRHSQKTLCTNRCLSRQYNPSTGLLQFAV
ncbi:MAG: hypothetical protein ABH879_06290, partial [archaeon]